MRVRAVARGPLAEHRAGLVFRFPIRVSVTVVKSGRLQRVLAALQLGVAAVTVGYLLYLFRRYNAAWTTLDQALELLSRDEAGFLVVPLGIAVVGCGARLFLRRSSVVAVTFVAMFVSGVVVNVVLYSGGNADMVYPLSQHGRASVEERAATSYHASIRTRDYTYLALRPYLEGKEIHQKRRTLDPFLLLAASRASNVQALKYHDELTKQQFKGDVKKATRELPITRDRSLYVVESPGQNYRVFRFSGNVVLKE